MREDCSHVNRRIFQSYTKKFTDQKLQYEEEKKRLSSNDLQAVDADERAKRIENRVKKVRIPSIDCRKTNSRKLFRVFNNYQRKDHVLHMHIF